MKRQMTGGFYRSAAIMTAAVMLLGEPMYIQAAELNDTNKESAVNDTEELLTAGVGDLFISPLTKIEYVEIARQAEGAMWGYTHLGICNVDENNLSEKSPTSLQNWWVSSPKTRPVRLSAARMAGHLSPPVRWKAM